MPFGVPGDLSRPSVATVEAQPYNSSLPFASYGIPGKIANGLFVPISTSADIIYGFLVRPYPTTGANASDPLGTGVPLASALLANIMRRGYMNVVCNAGTPTLGGAVYVRYANGTLGTPIGGLEATSVGGSNFAITATNGSPVYFTGPADGAGNCEIAYNI
jgi:hypothetical protein